MSKFRETLWFKKGELDVKAAEDPEGPGAVDLLPVEDRYLDDGSVAAADTSSFGVHSGQTQSLEMLKRTRQLEPVGDVPAQLVSELKRGRLPVLAAIGGALVAIAVIVCML
jgi:hypothetical protein